MMYNAAKANKINEKQNLVLGVVVLRKLTRRLRELEADQLPALLLKATNDFSNLWNLADASSAISILSQNVSTAYQATLDTYNV
jgi:hypothetical protein